MRRAQITALAAVLALASPALAGAGDSQACTAVKLKAAGKYARCRLLAESRFARSNDPARRSDRLTRCTDKLKSAFAKAERRYASACATADDALTVDRITGAGLADLAAYLDGHIPALAGSCEGNGVQFDPASGTCRPEILLTDSVSPPPGYSWTHGRADSWSKLDIEFDRGFVRGFSAAAAVGHRIYVFGTLDGATGGPTQASADVVILDVEAETLSTGTAMPIERHGHAAASLAGKIHVVGGQDGNGALARHDVYDPATDSWTRRAPLLLPRSYLGLVALDDRLYAVGGSDATGAPSSALDEYDPQTDSWRPRANLPPGFWGLTSAAHRGLIYVVGFADDGDLDSDMQVYSPYVDVWASKESEVLLFGQAIASSGPRIYLIGGHVVACDGHTDIYDPRVDRWTSSDVPGRRAEGFAVPIDDEIYVFGGVCTGGSDHVDVYVPDSYVHRLD